MLIDLPNASIDNAIEALKQLKEKLSINNQLLVKAKIYLTFKIANNLIEFQNTDNDQANHLLFRNGILCCNHEELCPDPKIPWYINNIQAKNNIIIDIPLAKFTTKESNKIARKQQDRIDYLRMRAFEMEQDKRRSERNKIEAEKKAAIKEEHEKRMQTDPAYAKEINDKKEAHREKCKALAKIRKESKTKQQS
jgi:hypothetical protein